MTDENFKRLDILYKKHNDWLMKCAFNNTKNMMDAEELVQNLYVYLGTKGNPKLYYLDSFNLKYCYLFIRSRFINKVKRDSKLDQVDETTVYNIPDIDYDYDEDNLIEETYNNINKQLKIYKKQKKANLTAATIFDLYHKDKKTTINSLANKLNLNRITVYLSLKRVKQMLNEELKNPYKK